MKMNITIKKKQLIFNNLNGRNDLKMKRRETINESEQAHGSNNKKKHFAGLKTCDTNRKQLHLFYIEFSYMPMHSFELDLKQKENETIVKKLSYCYLFQLKSLNFCFTKLPCIASNIFN